MSAHERKNPPAPPARDKAPRSGEGADTALEALIRKRKLAENPEAPDSIPPLDPSPDPARSNG
jgi:hypothetical protein